MNMDSIQAPLVIVSCIFAVVCLNSLTNSMADIAKSQRDIKASSQILSDKFRYKLGPCPGCY